MPSQTKKRGHNGAAEKPRPPALYSEDGSPAAAGGSPVALPSPVQRQGRWRQVDKNLKPASPWTRELDFSEVLYTPHTVLCLVGIVLGVLLMLRYYYYPGMELAQQVKLGLSAALFVFVGFGAVNLPDSIMVRPHPAIWRGILACCIAYLVLLTFLLFMDFAAIKRLLGFYDPALLVPLPERAYAQDCRISTPEEPYLFFHTAFDIFILAHSLGYVFKALILRDWRMVTAVSLGFEIVEVTFQHALPNFRECWWDHLLLDVLICNTGGTIVGMWLLRKFEAKQYNWVALKDIKTVGGKAQRVLEQFGPRSFSSYEWRVFDSPKRFFQVSVVLALMLLQELNCFTSKSILNMSPEYPLVLARLALMCFVAMPGLREFYEYLSNPDVKRVGTTFWVTLATLAMETIWIVKMMREGAFFQELMPVYIVVPWMFVIATFATWLLLFFGALSRKTRERRSGAGYHLVNLLFYAATLGLLAIFCMGMPDLQLGRAFFVVWVAPHQDRIVFWRN